MSRDQSEDRDQPAYLVTYVHNPSYRPALPWRVVDIRTNYVVGYYYDAAGAVRGAVRAEADLKALRQKQAEHKKRELLAGIVGPADKADLALRVVLECRAKGRDLTPYEHYQLACAVENGD
jgi:hypothetical protein